MLKRETLEHVVPGRVMLSRGSRLKKHPFWTPEWSLTPKEEEKTRTELLRV